MPQKKVKKDPYERLYWKREFEKLSKIKRLPKIVGALFGVAPCMIILAAEFSGVDLSNYAWVLVLFVLAFIAYQAHVLEVTEKRTEVLLAMTRLLHDHIFEADSVVRKEKDDVSHSDARSD